MIVLVELNSNDKEKSIQLQAKNINKLIDELNGFNVAVITECHISLMDGENSVSQCHVEIYGMTPELLLKVCRFYFYEMAWECLHVLAPRLTEITKQDKELLKLKSCCEIVSLDAVSSVTMLDKTVDYLQSLEDFIRCGQVTFKDCLTDTNVNRTRLSTLLVTGGYLFVENPQDTENLVELIQVVVPEFTLETNDIPSGLCAGLESMIGYVNSICD